MAAHAVALHRSAAEEAPAIASRDEVVARYRRLREICREHHSKAMKFVSGDAMLKQADRLGLRGRGRTFVLDSIDDMAFVFDLLLHTAPSGRSRGIDRYAAAAPPSEGEEARALRSMLDATFRLIRIERRHEIAGLVALDLARGEEFWLLDLSMEMSAPDGATFATRLFAPAEFSMTTGVIVPIQRALMEQVMDKLPSLRRKPLAEAIDDRRFAETLYRTAFATGIMENVRLLQ